MVCMHQLTVISRSNHPVLAVKVSRSSFSKPDMIISDPVTFFSCQSIPIGTELNYLSDVEFSESITVESI